MEDAMECYPGSCSRPDELSEGGRGECCCVPGCKNTRYDKHGEKTKIGLFRFPKNNPTMMKKWETTFKNIRRKGGSDVFDQTNFGL